VGRAALLIGAAIAIGLILLHRGGGAGPVSISGNSPTTSPLNQVTTLTTQVGASTPTTARGATTVPTTIRAAPSIKVLVANGTSTPGLAGKVSNDLHAKGYTTLASVNATQKPPSTVVYFQPSYSADAAALASKLNVAATGVQAMPSPPPVSNLSGANILVIVGPDLASTSTTPTT
jgi:hypothetical protein